MAEPSIAAQVAALQSMSVAQLRLRHFEVVGSITKSRHKQHLVKRISRKLQEHQLSKLTVEEETKVEEYRAMLRQMPPERWFPGKQRRPKRPTRPPKRQPPKLGSVITREYEGQEITVTVRENGFEYQSHVYRSLSAVAKEITGTTWNGWRFFGLDSKGGRR